VKRQSLLISIATALAAAAVLALAVGHTAAQEPPPPELSAPRTLVGNTFTYQGRLIKNNSPVSDTCDFQFSLWDDSSSGSQIGSTQTANGVTVSDGYFSAELNGSNQFGAYPFTGDARYLQIAVQCPGDSSFVSLNGRAALNATPYALGLRPGAVISGTGTTLSARTSSNSANALSGEATATTGNASGVSGNSKSPNGAGVVGIQSGSGGYGVYGSASATGFGVYGSAPTTGTVGIATAGSGPTWGVYGRSAAPSGAGVWGENTSGGTTYGVYGVNNSASGAGVWGSSRNSAGTGVQGETVSGAGVAGVVSLTGAGTGVYGGGGFYGHAARFENMTAVTATVLISNLNYAAGGPAARIWGTTAITGDAAGGALAVWNDESSGAAHGIYGEAGSTSGYGVYGYNSGGTGVYGSAGTGSGTGVSGYAGGGTGVYGKGFYGVIGQTDWEDGIGGRFVNIHETYDRDNVGMWAGSYGGDIIQGHELWADGSSYNLRFRVTYTGTVFADGYYNRGLGSSCFNTGAGADVAERIDTSDTLEPGDVVEIDPENPAHFRLARTAYSKLVAGVVSTRPGITMNNNDLAGNDTGERSDDRPLLALVGQVPVKVSAENGPIAVGDLLVASSTPGHAMRAGDNPPVGTVLGKALEGLESGTGLIQMLAVLQ